MDGSKQAGGREGAMTCLATSCEFRHPQGISEVLCLRVFTSPSRQHLENLKLHATLGESQDNDLLVHLE